MKIFVLFWCVFILQKDVSALSHTTPMRPPLPEDSQTSRITQIINFINLLKKNSNVLRNDKRRTELTGLKEINPYIENIYSILKYDDQQNFRRIPSKHVNSVRYHLLENPEILEDFRRKFKKKKAIRKQSHESSASLNAVSASVEGDTYTRTLQRRYDLEYLPDLDPNFEELDSYKKKGEFGQLIPKNSEVQEDVAPQSDDGNGPHLEPEINQNENLEPKSIFGESLPIIKSAEVEAITENIVEKKYLKKELVEHKKRKPKLIKPKIIEDEGDYDRGTYQKHSLEGISSERRETSTTDDINNDEQEVKSTESNYYKEKGNERKKRFKLEHKINSAEVTNEQWNGDAQDETVDPHKTTKKHKNWNDPVKEDSNEENDSKERKPSTEWDLNGKNNEYKYVGNEKAYDWIKEEEEGVSKNDEKKENFNKKYDKNVGGYELDYDHKKYDKRNQNKKERDKENKRNVKSRDKNKNADSNMKHKERGDDDDALRYGESENKNNYQDRDWNKKRIVRDEIRDVSDKIIHGNNKNQNKDRESKNNDMNTRDKWDTKNYDWQIETDDWNLKRDHQDEGKDVLNTERDDWTTKQDNLDIKHDFDKKYEKHKDWNNDKDEWNEKNLDWEIEKDDDWTTKTYDTDNENGKIDERQNIDKSDEWDGHDKTKRKDNWNKEARINREKDSWDAKDVWKFEYSIRTKQKKAVGPTNDGDNSGDDEIKEKDWKHNHTKTKSLKEGKSVKTSKKIGKDFDHVNVGTEDSVKQFTTKAWERIVPKIRDRYRSSKKRENTIVVKD